MILKGKKGIIFGALDDKSIAWKVAEQCKAEINHYKKERVHTLSQSVVAFAENQLAVAKQHSDALCKLLLGRVIPGVDDKAFRVALAVVGPGR